MSIRFEWKCGFMGRSFFRVYGDGPDYEISCRRSSPSDYDLETCNGYNVVRQIFSEVGNLRREHPITVNGQSSWLVSREVLDAFNGWVRAQREESNARLLAKYPEYEPDEVPADLFRAEFDLETGVFVRVRDEALAIAA